MTFKLSDLDQQEQKMKDQIVLELAWIVKQTCRVTACVAAGLGEANNRIKVRPVNVKNKKSISSLRIRLRIRKTGTMKWSSVVNWVLNLILIINIKLVRQSQKVLRAACALCCRQSAEYEYVRRTG